MSKKKARKMTAKKKATARKAPVRRATPLKSHDDPIVADNAAMEFDFTRPPQDLEDGKLWARSCSGFDHLEPEFDGEPQQNQAVKRVSSLTFTYSKRNGRPREEELVFTTTANGGVVVSVAVDKLKFKSNGQKRFLVPATLQGLRLRTVSGEDPEGTPFTVDLFDDNRPKFDDVRFTIVAVPADDEKL